MLKLLWTLFWQFFKTGLLALGGGLATLPFLYEMMDTYHWFTSEDLLDMIAVSESTPGPIGVNMATYVGYHATGGSFIGGIVTTLGLVAPSVIIICIIARAYNSYKNNQLVQDAFYGLRPAVCAMIASAGLGVLSSVLMPTGSLVLNSAFWINAGLFALLLIVSLTFKKLHPIALICICAAIGIILQL